MWKFKIVEPNKNLHNPGYNHIHTIMRRGGGVKSFIYRILKYISDQRCVCMYVWLESRVLYVTEIKDGYPLLLFSRESFCYECVCWMKMMTLHMFNLKYVVEVGGRWMCQVVTLVVLPRVILNRNNPASTRLRASGLDPPWLGPTCYGTGVWINLWISNERVTA